MKNCVNKSGLNFSLIQTELRRYGDLETQVLYLRNILDTCQVVYEDLDNLQVKLEDKSIAVFKKAREKEKIKSNSSTFKKKKRSPN